MGTVKDSAYSWAGGDEETVTILVIDALALKRISSTAPAPVTIIASGYND